MSVSRVLVYGGRGALGSAVVEFFKSKSWVSQLCLQSCNVKVILVCDNAVSGGPLQHTINTQWVLSVDLVANEQADANVLLAATDSWQQQGAEVSYGQAV